MTELRENLGRANPNDFPDAMREAGVMRIARVRTARGAVVGDVLELAEEDRALNVATGYAVAGGATGALGPALAGTAPAAGFVGVTPEGNLAFNAADAVTEAEVTYITIDADEPVDLQLPVVAGVMTLPGDLRAGVILSAQDLTVPATPVALTVLYRGASPGGATEVAVGDDPNTIVFDAAVTSASVRVLPQSDRTLNDRLATHFG